MLAQDAECAGQDVGGIEDGHVHGQDLQLDHMIADGAVRPAGPAQAFDTGLSDHWALVVDAEFSGS